MDMNTRVWLPSSQGEPHRGQVTAVDGDRFRVSWDSPGQHKPREPRSRNWYTGDLHRLQVGTPETRS